MKKQAIIAGGGPAGLTCAIYLARAGWNVTVFINEEGTVSSLEEAPCIENFPGFPEPLTGAELLDRMTQQALNNGVLMIGNGIQRIDGDEQVAVDTGGSSWHFDAFVEAVGTTPRRFEFRSEPEGAAIPIHTCAVCDGGLFRGTDSVMVIGAGDTAFTNALYLSGIVGRVYLAARRDKFRATNLAAVEEFKKRPNSSILVNAVVTAIRDEGNGEYTAEINNGEEHVRVNGFFSCIGYDENDIPLKGTNKRVFSCGDCVAGSEKQAVIAAASGAEAALDIIRIVI